MGANVVFLKLIGSIEAGVQFLRSEGRVFRVYYATKVIWIKK